MCGFCLKESVPLDSVLSMDEHRITYFDKIASSLTNLANLIELDSHFELCQGCLDIIDKINHFNEVCLKNIETFISYKRMLKGNLNKKQCNVKMKLNKNESVTITVKNEVVSDGPITETNCCHSDYIVSGIQVKEETIVKSEIENEVETFDENNFDLDMTEVKLKIEIEEDDMKKKCFGEDDGAVLEEEKAASSSKDEVLTFDPDVGETGSNKLEQEEMLSTSDEEQPHESRSNSPEQFLVRNKQTPKYKKHICHVCNKTFTYKHVLNNHLRIHTGEKPYICSICKKSFNQKGHLDIHMLIHSDEKSTNTCDMCSKVFRYKWNLNKHRLIHIGVKAFSCKVCNKSFTWKHHLVGHKRIHTGEKPYICDVCEKIFTHKHSLTRHRRLHMGEKPDAFDICHKAFAVRSNLIAHRKIHKN